MRAVNSLNKLFRIILKFSYLGLVAALSITCRLGGDNGRKSDRKLKQ